MKTIPIGDIVVYAINDLSETSPIERFPSVSDDEWAFFNKLFLNRYDLSKRITQHFTYYCYIIKTPSTCILVDLGVGGGEKDHKTFAPEWNGTLIEQMEQAGISPRDIDIVFPTHIHPDHIGWGTFYDGKQFANTFPNAQYYASRYDWDITADVTIRSGFPEGCFEQCFEPVMDSGSLTLLTDETVDLCDGVSAHHIPGHTPGLYCFVVEFGGKRCVLTGDMIADPLQIYEPNHYFVYDMDRAKASAWRKKILSDYASEGTVVGGCHYGPGVITVQDGKLLWNEL